MAAARSRMQGRVVALQQLTERWRQCWGMPGYWGPAMHGLLSWRALMRSLDCHLCLSTPLLLLGGVITRQQQQHLRPGQQLSVHLI